MILFYIALAVVGAVSCAAATWPYLGAFALLTMPLGASLAAGLAAVATFRLASRAGAEDTDEAAVQGPVGFQPSDVTTLVEALRSIRRLADKRQTPHGADESDREPRRRVR